jgi:twinkle protein
MSDLPPLPEAPVYEIPMAKFTARYKVRLGDLAVFTGIPSHGKSSFVNDVCCRLVEAHGLSIAFASFEQMPQRDHRRNLRTWFAGKPTSYFAPEDFRTADTWIDKYFSFLVPSEDDDVTLEWLLDKAEASVIQHGARVVVIDPWNEMDHARSREESLTEYTGRAIKALRRFAKKLMVHVIIVAHPSKQQKDENGDYRVPTLYDVSDSAHWYNKADIGIVVHRYSDHTLLRVAKSRYHDEIGIPGDEKAHFHFEQRRFEIQ